MIHLSDSWVWVKPLNYKMFDHGLIREFHGHWVELRDLSHFLELCKQWPDSPEDFPKGKWASIQRLQVLVETHAEEAIRQVMILPE